MGSNHALVPTRAFREFSLDGLTMYQKIKALLYRRPYLTAVCFGFLWNLFFIYAGILALTSSAVLIGIVIGLFRVARWQDVFKKFPASLGCYVIVAFLYVFTGMAIGGQRELEPILTAVITAFTIPFLLVGEWIGWVLRPSSQISDQAR